MEDEFELPRVMWVPDSMEDQEDFFPKKRKGESIECSVSFPSDGFPR
jgi:hypothetical protein